MSGPRRRAALAAGLGLLVGARAQGAGWPQRPVRWLVGYGAGGTSDVVARLLGRAVSDASGQPVVVENRPGGGAIAATELAVRGPTDGSLLLHVDNAMLVYNPALHARLPFDPDVDLLPVTLVMGGPMVVVVRQDSPYRSYADMQAAGRRQALAMGSPGFASPHHLAMELLRVRAGLNAVHVPFRGGPPAIQEMLAGRLDGMMLDVPNLLPLLRAGQARALAVTHAERWSFLPEVPTLRELGHDAVAGGWQGVSVARGTPPEGVAGIAAGLAAAIGSAPVAERLRSIGAMPYGGGTAAFTARLAVENPLWRGLIRELGLKVDG